MTEMIDRVAQAMSDAVLLKHQILLDDQAKTLAQVAIETMLNPTATMVHYGWQKSNLCPEWEIARIYRGMIYAALGKIYEQPK